MEKMVAAPPPVYSGHLFYSISFAPLCPYRAPHCTSQTAFGPEITGIPKSLLPLHYEALAEDACIPAEVQILGVIVQVSIRLLRTLF